MALFGEDGQLLFEIKGKAKWLGLKRYRSYVAVCTDRIRIEMWGNNDTYTQENIPDVYIREPVVEGVKSRTVLLKFCENGEYGTYDLDDKTFPGLAEKMERVLEKEWSHILKMRDCPQTVRWFTACCAAVKIVSGENPHIFGGVYKEPQSIAEYRKVLCESWRFNDRQDFLHMLPNLLEGYAVKQYGSGPAAGVARMSDSERALRREIADEGGERCIWVWDLQRLILISALGYVADWLAREEALDWCLKAGQKLQGLCRNWDDFMRCYLLSYCLWSGDSLKDRSSIAGQRRQAYEYYRQLPGNPWQVAWNYPLTREW
jgi:hypothetical protein